MRATIDEDGLIHILLSSDDHLEEIKSILERRGNVFTINSLPSGSFTSEVKITPQHRKGAGDKLKLSKDRSRDEQKADQEIKGGHLPVRRTWKMWGKIFEEEQKIRRRLGDQYPLNKLLTREEAERAFYKMDYEYEVLRYPEGLKRQWKDWQEILSEEKGFVLIEDKSAYSLEERITRKQAEEAFLKSMTQEVSSQGKKEDQSMLSSPPLKLPNDWLFENEGDSLNRLPSSSLEWISSYQMSPLSQEFQINPEASFEELVYVAEKARLVGSARVESFREEHYRHSLKAYLLAFENKPDDLETLKALISVYLELGELEKARDLLAGFISRNPQLVDNMQEQQQAIDMASQQGGRLKDKAEVVGDILYRHMVQDAITSMIFHENQELTIGDKSFIVDEVHHNAETQIRDDKFQYYAIGREILTGRKVVFIHIEKLERAEELALINELGLKRAAEVLALGEDNNGNTVLITSYLPESFDDFIMSKTLAELSDELPSTLEDAIAIGEDLLTLEQDGLNHGDLQHQNVRLTEKGEWRLIDFGDSCYVDDVKGLAALLYAATTGNILHSGLFIILNNRLPGWAIVNKGKPQAVRELPHVVNPKIPQELSELIWAGLKEKMTLEDFVTQLKLHKDGKVSPDDLIEKSQEFDSDQNDISSDNAQLGGIDFNPNALNLQTEGEGLEFNFPLAPHDLRSLENMSFDGLTPVVNEIIPVTNLHLLLGLSEDRKMKVSDKPT